MGLRRSWHYVRYMLFSPKFKVLGLFLQHSPLLETQVWNACYVFVYFPLGHGIVSRIVVFDDSTPVRYVKGHRSVVLSPWCRHVVMVAFVKRSC